MIKAIILDFNGVLEQHGKLDQELVAYVAGLDDMQLAVMTQLDLLNLKLALFQAPKGLFTGLFARDNTSASKPYREAFIEAAKELGCQPEECLFVDDSRANVDGAAKAGMQAVLFTDTTSGIEQIEAIIESAKN